jgi:hypothetical protein
MLPWYASLYKQCLLVFEVVLQQQLSLLIIGSFSFDKSILQQRIVLPLATKLHTANCKSLHLHM